jgi:cell division septal protein FtsQ
MDSSLRWNDEQKIMNKSYNSKKLLHKKKKMFKWKVAIWCILIVALIIGFIYWMRHPNMNIETIRIVQNTFSKSERIEANVSRTLDGNIFLLIPKTNSLFLSRFQTEEKLKEEFPEIEKIDIDLKGTKEIEVQIYEWEPKMIWISGEGENFFINKEGNIFLEEPMLHGYDDLLKLQNEKQDLTLGANVINPDFMKELISFSEDLESLQIKVREVRHEDDDVFYLSTNKDFEIIISSNDSLKDSYENFKTILEDGVINKENLSVVEYIDLRFGNKIFYRLKGDSETRPTE